VTIREKIGKLHENVSLLFPEKYVIFKLENKKLDSCLATGPVFCFPEALKRKWV
jgi:hypothetical protein